MSSHKMKVQVSNNLGKLYGNKTVFIRDNGRAEGELTYNENAKKMSSQAPRQNIEIIIEGYEPAPQQLPAWVSVDQSSKVEIKFDEKKGIWYIGLDAKIKGDSDVAVTEKTTRVNVTVGEDEPGG